jgi:ParB family chromosome partitioning protein
MKIKLNRIKPSPRAIRSTWSEEGLDELAQSIKENGLIVPIKVRPTVGKYEIVYGHRRVKAMRRAGFQEIEAIVEDVEDNQVILEALIENVQHEDMEPIDIAKALFALQEETGWSQTEMGNKGVLPSRTISRYMALLRENIKTQKLVTRSESGGPGEERTPKGKVTVSHVDQVRESGLESDYRTAIIEKAAKEGLTAEETRRVAESVKSAPSEEAKMKVLEWEYSPTLHDPERLKARAEEYGPQDPLYQEPAAEVKRDWRGLPAVVAVVDSIKGVRRKELPAWIESTDKLPAEARRYIARIARNLADDLVEWAEELEA